MYRLMMLSLTSSTIIVKLLCSMMESPGKRWSVGKLVKVREWWISEKSPSPPPSAVIRAVAAEGVVIVEIGVWTVGGKLALLQTGNLYVPAAHEGVKLSPAVLDAVAVKLQEGDAGGLRWCCPPSATADAPASSTVPPSTRRTHRMWVQLCGWGWWLRSCGRRGLLSWDR